MLKIAQEHAMSRQVTDTQEEADEVGMLEDHRDRNSLRSMMPRHSVVEAHGAGFLSQNLSVQPMTGLKTIAFDSLTLPKRYADDQELRNLLSDTFPQLCEAPHAVMVDDAGNELPPLKYEETSELERKARKEALVIHVRGIKKHTLVKSYVILESRGVSWKRIGAVDLNSLPASQRNRASRQALSALDPLPNPWDIEIYHEDSETRNIKGSARRIFELPQSRRCGLCPKCDGHGTEPCGICKGDAPDECFWCSGTGRDVKRMQRCQPCGGSGKLQCKTCNGKLTKQCKACSGEGTGMFSVIVQIKVRRVDFAPVPLLPVLREHRVSESDTAAVKAAVIKRTWDAINKLTEASGVKHKHTFRPLAASCSCDASQSQLLEVDVPQSGRFRKHHAQHGTPGTMPRGQQATGKDERKKPSKGSYMKRYFVVPSDTSLHPVEMSEEDFELSIIAKQAMTQASAQLLSQSVRPQDTGIYSRSSSDSNRTTGGNSLGGRHTPGRIAFASATPPLMTPALTSLLQPGSMGEVTPSLSRSDSKTRRVQVVKKLAGPLLRSSSRGARKQPPSVSLPSTPLVNSDAGMDSYFGTAVAAPQVVPAPESTGTGSSSAASDAGYEAEQPAIRRSISLRALRNGTSTTTAGMYQARPRVSGPPSPPRHSSGEDAEENERYGASPRTRHSARTSTASSTASTDAFSARSTMSSEDGDHLAMATPTAAPSAMRSPRHRQGTSEGNYI